jgi:hypothetical protein
MKYIHVECLEKWRHSGPPNAKFECPQCHYRYNLSRLTVSRWLDQRCVVPTLTLIIFLGFWSACVLTSFASVKAGLLINVGDSSHVWTSQHMFNGVILAGLLGVVYSLFTDGFGVCCAVFSRQSTRSSLGLIAVACIFLGLARAVAAIYVAVSSFASGARDGIKSSVLDIRDVEKPHVGEDLADSSPPSPPPTNQLPAGAAAAHDP